MHFMKKDAAILIGCFVFVFALVLLAPVVTHGDEWNLSTKFMISQPTEVPGLVLQPNTQYVIRLLDSTAERRVVEIFNADQTKMLTTFMAAADERSAVTDRTVFTFIETEPGYPMPIKEWFYPGHPDGLEFIYPKKQARVIAEHALEPVLSADAGSLHDLATLSVEAGKTKELPTATSTASVTKTAEPVVETKPAPPAVAENSVTNEQAEPAVQQPDQIAQNNTESNTNSNVSTESNTESSTETATTPESSSPAPQELPRTAGELPLIAMIGALCLGAGLGMKVLSSNS